MPEGSTIRRLFLLATLPRSRELLRGTRGAWLLVASIAILYGFVSMLVGLMLELGPTNFRTTSVTVLLTAGPGDPWWNYPALLVVAPNAVLALPFFATLSMVLVSLGVGLGMAVAVVLSLRLLRQRRRALGTPAGLGTVAGLTPAMIALVTLGACCSTTAAATAGIGLAAQASGTTLAALLVNTWYLGVFQIVVLGAALLAQEQLAEVYGYLLDPARARPMSGEPAAATVTPRYLASGALRVGLLAAGVTWGLALAAEWTTAAPSATSGVAWFNGLFEHLLPAIAAVVAALAPGAFVRALTGAPSKYAAWVLRAALVVGGVALVGWLPAVVVQAGAHGLVNEILGAWGAPAAWGAVTVPGVGGLALALRWGFQFGLLGAFAIAAAVAPRALASLLLPSRAGSTEPGAASGVPDVRGRLGAPSSEDS